MMLRLRALAAFLALILVVATSADGKTKNEPPNTLLGKVVEHQDGEPVAKARVSAWHRESGQFGTVRATATGAFVLAHLPAGTYRILVESETGIFVSESMVKLHGGVRRACRLRLEPGSAPLEAVHDLELPRDAEESIVGTLELEPLSLQSKR